jgi:ATP-dependent helicase/nuclease subunit A
MAMARAEQLDLFAVSELDDSSAPDASTSSSPIALPRSVAAHPPAPDQAARDLVEQALDTTLFVAAGAGSGKTTALVGRVVNLVLSGVPITSIAAITFTEKAAAELRHRVRTALDRRVPGRDPNGLAAAAVLDLDQAPIGTLHAFARRLLSEFPVESRLPPRFDVLDEVQSATAYSERWNDFLEALLDRPDAVRLVELCEHEKFRIEVGGRRMADDFQSNWDLVEERVSGELPAPYDANVDGLLRLVDAIEAIPVPPEDAQATTVSSIGRLAHLLRDDPTLGDLLRHLSDLKAIKPGRLGNKTKWKAHGGADELDRLRALETELAALAARQLVAFHDERRLTLGALLREFTLGAVEERRADGRLEFHDLLVFARRLVADHADVRAAIHQRYTRLLLDEFQDTDPIQLELAVRITADPDVTAPDGGSLRPLPGRLCVVGDAKQSIYRFRRADIAQFMSAERTIEATAATLSANFRSTPAVIDWVNHTMGTLIEGAPDVQPDYEPLDACRTSAPHPGTVTVLGGEQHPEPVKADVLRKLEADDVADVIVQALVEGWPVTRIEDGTPTLGPCRPGDIAVLLPARTSLPLLQVALADRGIAYRAENSSLVYAAPEVRALLLALRAADDPTDELAIVSTLRTPLFGCSDRHLFEWRVTHGLRWDWQQAVPHELAGHPIAVALACLGRLAEAIPWSTPSELLTSLVDERSVLELALATRHGRDVWRRVRFVIDQARAWSEAGGHGVRHYLTWTRLQGDDGRFIAETVLPETDHDAVRVMTVHAAKGLEFPITIVSGLTTKPGGVRSRRVVWTKDSWTLTDKDDPVYQEFQPLDEQMSDAERRRLLYVATTRAQDHLVVSLHRDGRTPNSSASLLAAHSGGANHRQFVAHDHLLFTSPADAIELPWADEEAWAATRDAALARAATSTVLSATALARRFTPERAADPALQKDAVDLDLPPWQRGRYGTAIGRAVHAVLQHADLAHGADIDTLAASQAAAEGVLGLETTIAALARSAMATDIVANGIRGEHWRELFVATAFGEQVVEGYIDLLVRHPRRGLVVVDYKTDQLHLAPDRIERLQKYGLQLAAYGIALEQLLHEPVTAGVLVMCSAAGPAEEVEVRDWADVQANLRASLA